MPAATAPTFENDFDPPVEQIATNTWELQEPWRYTWKRDLASDYPTHRRLVLPAGITFKPSVPRIAWPAVSPLETLTASLPHDLLYRTRGAHDGLEDWIESNTRPDGGLWRASWKSPGWQPLSRHTIDRLFRRIMRQQGQASWRTCIAYSAVRAYGWVPWHDLDERIQRAVGA